MFYQTEHFGVTDYFRRAESENFSFAPHLHQSFELILLTEGTMSVTVDEITHELKAGQAALIFPNQVHALSSTKSKHSLFIFSPQIVQSFFTEKRGMLPKNNVFFLPQPIVRAVLALTQSSSRYQMKGTLYTVCAHFDETAEYYKVESDRQELLLRMLYYVENNFREDCTLKSLSSNVGYNPEYLSRFFKRKMGIPYNTYLNMRRVNHAVYLLNNSDETCLTCALESGYLSLRSFNRNFKQFIDVSPQQHRMKKTSK